MNSLIWFFMFTVNGNNATVMEFNTKMECEEVRVELEEKVLRVRGRTTRCMSRTLLPWEKSE